MYTYVSTYVHAYIHAYIHTYYVYIRTYIRTYVHAYIHTYTHAYIHTGMQACIHTYTRLLIWRFRVWGPVVYGFRGLRLKVFQGLEYRVLVRRSWSSLKLWESKLRMIGLGLRTRGLGLGFCSGYNIRTESRFLNRFCSASWQDYQGPKPTTGASPVLVSE